METSSIMLKKVSRVKRFNLILIQEFRISYFYDEEEIYHKLWYLRHARVPMFDLEQLVSYLDKQTLKTSERGK